MQQTTLFAASVLIAVSMVAVAADAPLFLSTPTISLLAGQPTVILTPDLDGDGRDDVVVTNYETARLTPLLNQGDGTLQRLDQFSTGGQAVGGVAALVDGDEIVDVVIAEVESDNAWFVRGRGDGTFDAPRGPIVVGHDPLTLSGGDFNEDGHFDLAIALSPEGPSSLNVVLGNGDGTFAAPVLSQRIEDFGIAVAVGDFNNDQHLDIAGSFSQTAIGILLGRGDGTFADLQQVPTVSRSFVILPSDINGDGKLDLFLAQSGADAVAVLLGNGDGSFAPVVSYPAGAAPGYAALADVNADDAPDAILHGTLSRDVRVLLGNGVGGFGPPRAFAAIGEVQVIGSLHLDADEIADVVAGTQLQGDPGLALFYGQVDGSLAAAENLLGDTATGAAVADVNNDGLPDLIAAIPTAQRVGVFVAQVMGGFAPLQRTDAVGFPAGRVGAGDFDADGNVDVLAASVTTRQALVLEGRGDATFATGALLSLPSGGGLVSAQAVDVDADGNLDAVLSQADGAVTVFPGNGNGSFAEALPATATSGGGAPAFGDFNNDRVVDFAIINSQLGRVAIFHGVGNGSFTVGPTITASRQAPVIAAADFNLDGVDDLAVADSLNRQIRVLINDGSGQFPNPVLVRTDELPMSFAARDVAGDGRPDLLVATQGNALLTAFTNGDTFVANPPAGTGLRPSATLSADFNGDGRYDVATLNSIGTLASVVSNTGGTRTARGDANGDTAVGAADVIGLLRELAEAIGQRVDTTGRGFPTAAGADANGDGIITRQDLGALLARVF